MNFKLGQAMKHNWEIVKIREIVQQSGNVVDVKPNETYPLLGLSLEGRGLFLRESKQGNNISSKTLNKVVLGDFIYSRLFAWKGAFDFIKEKYNGAFVSNEFPTFAVNNNVVDVKYLYFYFCQSKIWKEVEIHCTGVTKASRNRFKENHFLNLSIPLPPLAEQKCIVDKIESVQKRIEQIKQLRIEQEKEIKNLKYGIFEKLFSEYGSTNIGTFIEENLDSVFIDSTQQYQFAGVYGFGNGLFVKGLQHGNDTTYKTFNRLHKNQLVMSQPKGWEGAIALVSKEFDNLFLSPVYSTFTAKDNNNIKFVSEFCKLPTTWQKMLDVSKGIGARRNSIYAKDFLKIEIPNVPISEQDRIVLSLEKINQIRQTFKAQKAELTDLLPSLLDKVFKGELFKKETAKPIVRTYELESQYFVKRKMLGTYIINQSLNDEKFGDTKFEKIMHLTEYWAIKRNFNQQYYKKTAGAYDGHFTFAFYKQINESGWFTRQQKATSNQQSIFIIGKNHEKSKTDYGFFSAEELAKVKILLDLFKNSDYKVPEVVSTLYAVWNNRIILQQEISDEILIQDFYDWHEHKKVYTKEQVENSLKWMREKGLIPDGWGEVIERAKKAKKQIDRE